jgi:transcriptional regulator with XRE-family HTH domain
MKVPQNVLDTMQYTLYNLLMATTSRIREAIRQAMEAHPKTHYRIAKETGISQSMLSLFAAGKRGMTLERLEYLADYLGLDIIIRPKGDEHHG